MWVVWSADLITEHLETRANGRSFGGTTGSMCQKSDYYSAGRSWFENAALRPTWWKNII